MNEKTTETAQPGDERVMKARAIESMVLRGDISALGPKDRALFYVKVCEDLGLNPDSHPLAFLRLNGKEVLYATKGATDQLAFRRSLTREIIDGPKVIDLAGTKLVYAVARATLPGGRFETATATVPLVDPMNVLMKCETKAKRRVTLSILGLGMLDEMELETIPASVQEPGGGVDLSLARSPEGEGDVPAPQNEETAGPPAETHPPEVPAALASFNVRVAEIDLPGEAVGVWIKHRNELAPLSAADREGAWRSLCQRVEDVGKMKNAKVWLKKAIAEEDARRQNRPEPDPDPPSGGGTRGRRSSRETPANGHGAEGSGANDATQALSAFIEHIAAKPHAAVTTPEKRERELAEIAHSYLKRREELASAGRGDEAWEALKIELRRRGCHDPLTLLNGVADRCGYAQQTEDREAA